jgi:hypothetical protein
MRRRLAILLVVLAVSSCGGGSSTAPSGSMPTWRLAPIANRFVAIDGSDGSPDCAQTRPCRTIQRAHNVATVGEFVTVRAGTYDELLAISKGITIVADSGNATDTRLRGGAVVDLTAGTFDLRAFTLTPGLGATTGFNLTLRTGTKVIVAFTAIGAYSTDGIAAVFAGGSLEVTSSSSNRNTGDGIHVSGSSGTLTVDDTELRENIGDGLQFSGVGGIAATISRSPIRLNGEAGLQIEGMSSGSVTVTGSCVLNNTGSQAGLEFSNLSAGTVSVSTSDIAFNRIGASITTSAITPNLSGNWWNSASGPSGAGGGGGDSITAGLNFQPFATVAQSLGLSKCQ